MGDTAAKQFRDGIIRADADSRSRSIHGKQPSWMSGMVEAKEALTVMHREIEPAIHYWGTPVVLVSTLNEDGSANIAPISSVWWLGWSCMLGFDASSHSVANLRRERECVINLAAAENAGAVDRLARTTGSSSVPVHKRVLGYRHVADKAGHAGLTLEPSLAVRAPRVRECPVQLEAELVSVRAFGRSDPRLALPAYAVELRILKTHVEERLLLSERRVDPDGWRPLLMSFRELFVRGERAVSASRLAEGDESLYAPWQQGPWMKWAARGLGAIARLSARGDDAEEGGAVETV